MATQYKVKDLLMFLVKEGVPTPGKEDGFLKKVVTLAINNFVSEEVLTMNLPTNVNNTFSQLKEIGVKNVVGNVLTMLDDQLKGFDLMKAVTVEPKKTT